MNERKIVKHQCNISNLPDTKCGSPDGATDAFLWVSAITALMKGSLGLSLRKT